MSAAVAAGHPRRLCAWCRSEVPPSARRDSKFCKKRCRQASWRFNGYVSRATSATAGPMRFAYADPPYPGKAFYYPEQAEVDHASLVDRLTREFPDGWALSTSSRSLRDVLPLCPAGSRVCAWFKGPRPTRSRRAVMAWEPVILVGGRPLGVDVVQYLSDGLIACGRFRAFPGAMVGMKPPAFAVWLFQLLGAAAGDELVDLFPGSGAIGRAWIRWTAGDSSPEACVDASRPTAAARDVSPRGGSDVSLVDHASFADPGVTCLASSADA